MRLKFEPHQLECNTHLLPVLSLHTIQYTHVREGTAENSTTFSISSVAAYNTVHTCKGRDS